MEDKIQRLLEITLKGFTLNNLPAICKGFLNESLTRNVVTVETVLEMVDKNQSLWKAISQEDYDRLVNIYSRVGKVDWLTADWLIEAIKEKHAAIASLFLGWRKSYNWLERQVKEIKDNVDNLAKSVSQ